MAVHNQQRGKYYKEIGIRKFVLEFTFESALFDI